MNTWEIDSITSLPKFLTAVAQHLPTARTVSFEIQKACPEAGKVYAKHHSSQRFRPFRDTLSPKTQLHYCIMSASLAEDLERVLRGHEVKEVFWHVKGYGDQTLLFAIHDADMGDSMFLSAHIDAKIVHAIASDIGRKASKLQTGYDWDEDHRKKQQRNS
jgi:hypothetical protein